MGDDSKPPPLTAGATVFFSCPFAIHGGCGPKPLKTSFADLESETFFVSLHFRCLKTPSLPSKPLQTAHTPRQGPADRESFPIRRYATETGKTRPRFRRCTCARHHPYARKRSRHCLAANLAELSLTPTCGPLPDWAFETPGRPFPWHRKNHLPAATALPSLAMTFTDPITFLEGVTPRAVSPCVMGSRPCTVSTEAFLPRFLGAEHRSTPLPAGERFSQSGTVFGSTHWQALSGLSWLSYSPPCFSQGRRVWSFTRSLPVTRQGAPHASRVERALLRP